MHRYSEGHTFSYFEVETRFRTKGNLVGSAVWSMAKAKVKVEVAFKVEAKFADEAENEAVV